MAVNNHRTLRNRNLIKGLTTTRVDSRAFPVLFLAARIIGQDELVDPPNADREQIFTVAPMANLLGTAILADQALNE